jgi:hypothetical protein
MKSLVRFAIALAAVLAFVAPAMADNTISVEPQGAVPNEPCNLEGSFGLAVRLDGSGDQALVQDNTPDMETTFRARFRIDPNSITMPAGANHVVMGGNGPIGSVLRVWLLRDVGGTTYRVRAHARNDPAEPESYTRTNAITIGDAAREVEVEWAASSAPGADDGFVTIRRIDNGASATETGINNDEQLINRALFGAVTSMDAGDLGAYCLDDYSSFR